MAIELDFLWSTRTKQLTCKYDFKALELVQQCSAKNMSCTSAQAPNLHILDESSCEGDSLASPPQGASELSRGSNMWGGGVVGCSDLDDDAWWIERELARSFQVYVYVSSFKKTLSGFLATLLVGLQCVWLPSLTFGYSCRNHCLVHTLVSRYK